MCLRQWMAGSAARLEICHQLSQSLGHDPALEALEALEQICDLCGRYARRPLMRHQVNCKCLGADEACFANFVAFATEGAREDAMLIATLLVRPDLAPCLVGLAQNLGLALKRLPTPVAMPAVGGKSVENTLH